MKSEKMNAAPITTEPETPVVPNEQPDKLNEFLDSLDEAELKRLHDLINERMESLGMDNPDDEKDDLIKESDFENDEAGQEIA